MLKEVPCISIILRKVFSSFYCIVAESFDGGKFEYGVTRIFVPVNEIDKVHMRVCDSLSNNNEQGIGEIAFQISNGFLLGDNV
jgi:hypothetical protein